MRLNTTPLYSCCNSLIPESTVRCSLGRSSTLILFEKDGFLIFGTSMGKHITNELSIKFLHGTLHYCISPLLEIVLDHLYVFIFVC